MTLPPNEFIKVNHCPYCNHKATAAMRLEDEKEKPIPGALSICIECAKISVFNDDMNLDKFDMNTLDLEDHVYLVRLQYMTHGVHGRYIKEKKKH